MNERQVTRVIRAMPASDGAGVRLRRSLGQNEAARHDPFLMLDEIASDDASDYLAGFPPHPHRGFETVTYMIEGRMRHEDHLGNRGLLTGGGVQWMTAGRGIIHSEMPEQEEGRLHGFQLWINLPAAEKMRAPRYQDIAPRDVAEATRADGVRLRVIAGELEFDGARLQGPVRDIVTEPLFVDVTVPAGGDVELMLPVGHSAFVYPFENDVVLGASTIRSGEAALLGDGEGIVAASAASGPARMLLLAAAPIGEPVAQYGPFVMNRREEIEQAMRDYRDGRLAADAVEGSDRLISPD